MADGVGWLALGAAGALQLLAGIVRARVVPRDSSQPPGDRQRALPGRGPRPPRRRRVECRAARARRGRGQGCTRESPDAETAPGPAGLHARPARARGSGLPALLVAGLVAMGL